MNAEQILNESVVSRATVAQCYLAPRTVGLRSNCAKPL
jgi:hypothetical protein